MGLMDFIKGQLIEVIEWTDSSSDTIVYRFPVANKEIKMGAMLTVRESQAAVFVNEGVLADVFYPGLYELNTENMPILTKLKSWKYGFNSPFKAEVYFVNTKQFLDQRWGTQSPVIVKDPEIGQVRITARGKFSYRVVDPAKLMREHFGTKAIYKTSELEETFRSYIVQYMKDTIAEAKISLFDLGGQLIEFSAKVRNNIKEKFDQFGLEIVDLVVEDINLPPEAIAVHTDHRGKGLQRKLARAHLVLAEDLGYHHILCTVSPKNPKSLSNMLSCGFLIEALRPKFQGWFRFILHKDLMKAHLSPAKDADGRAEQIAISISDLEGLESV